MKKLTIVSLGMSDENELTLGTLRALRDAERVLLRTGRHGVASYLQSEGIAFDTLDELYETCEDFDTLSESVAQAVRQAAEGKETVYAVSDATGDATVAAILRLGCENVTVLGGASAQSRAMAALLGAGAPPAEGTLRVCPASTFLTARVTPSDALLLTELHSRECAGDCKLRLSSLLPDELEVWLLSGPNATVTRLPLYELDRQKHYDHLTMCYVPAVPMLKRTRFDMDDLVAVMARLRAPDGCPWDREQTHESLLPSLLEEAWEFIDAARQHDVEHMYDELGDVLLQVAFHAQVASEHGEFDIQDVTSAICGKMIERHTHIFGADHADTAEEVLTNWEAFKRKQRGIQTHADAMRDVSTGLSTLLRAAKVQRKAAKVHFDFDSAEQALAKVHEEADEVAENLRDGVDPETELGDLLFSIVNVCRLCDKNADIALFAATEKFITRFSNMEKSIKKSGKRLEDLTLSEMDVYWNSEKGAGTV